MPTGQYPVSELRPSDKGLLLCKDAVVLMTCGLNSKKASLTRTSDFRRSILDKRNPVGYMSIR